MGGLIGCVDLGGTKVRAGIVQRGKGLAGESVWRSSRVNEDRDRVLENIVQCVREAAERGGLRLGDLEGIGIGSPGPLDLENGSIGDAGNMGSLRHCPLVREIADRTGLPVYLDNDANVFVLGEALYGAGRGGGIVFGVTLGTGFGAGLVVNGALFSGATGTAAEIWCLKYGDGIIEEYVSGRAIARFFLERGGGEADPREISERAQKGMREALEAYREFGFHLGIGLSYAVNLIDPRVVVIGGSIAEQAPLFRESMERAFRENVTRLPRERCRIVLAERPEESPLLGAAALVPEGIAEERG